MMDELKCNYCGTDANVEHDCIDTLKAKNARLREAAEKLLEAAEMRRDFDIEPDDVFASKHPHAEGWSSGDVDYLFALTMNNMNNTLKGEE